MRTYLISLLAAVMASFATPGVAQQVQRIAAVVNDGVISVFDLNSRIQLAVVTTGLKDTVAVRSRIAPEVLRTLIDERLQMQEAKRRNISVTRRDEKRAIGQLERLNRLQPGTFKTFMTGKGVRIETVMAQIRASIAWSKLIRRRYRPRVRIGEDEVEEVLARIRSTRGQTEYRLAELFLSVDSPEQDDKVRRSARELTQQLRNGARFPAIARQFSQSATAAVGGDLGWLAQSALPPHLKTIVPKLALRRISDPIRTISGYQILVLRDRRKIAGSDPGKIKIALHQLFVPLPGDADGARRDERRAFASGLSDSLSGCSAMAETARKIKSPRRANLGEFNLAELSPSIRDAVAELAVGKASRPVPTQGGLLLFMVCKRDAPKTNLPGRDAIRKRLMGRRLDLIARRVLRDIRLAAIVDVRV